MTNNPSEGGNNRLASRMGAPHPGFYHFCNVLTKELKNSKSKLEVFESGNYVEPTRKTLHQNRLLLKRRLEENKIPLRKYLRAMGAMNHHKQKVQQLVEHLMEQGKCSCGLHLGLSQKKILIKVLLLKVTLPNLIL